MAGRARPVLAGSGTAQLGTAGLVRHGMVWPGVTWCGTAVMVWLGEASPGLVRQAWRGVASHGAFRRGPACSGGAWSVPVRRGLAGAVRRGKERRGWARPGLARRGYPWWGRLYGGGPFLHPHTREGRLRRPKQTALSPSPEPTRNLHT